MNDDDQAPEATPREVSAAILTTRAARELVKPVHLQLRSWQAASIKLQTMAKRIKDTGRKDADVAKQAHALLVDVGKQSAIFEASVSEVDEAIQVHGRVDDTRTVLRLIEERLNETLTDLGETPGSKR